MSCEEKNEDKAICTSVDILFLASSSEWQREVEREDEACLL